MTETIYEWMNQGGWWAVVIFIIGWIALGTLAFSMIRSRQLRILAALPTAAFGIGAHMLVSVQLYEVENISPGLLSLLPVIAGIASIIIIFIGASIHKQTSEKDHESKS